MTLPPCPHCHATCGCYVNARATGKIEYYFDVDGSHTESNHDAVIGMLSHVVRCVNCERVRRDLRLGEGFVVEAVR